MNAPGDIRVLVVDDSKTVLRLLTYILGERYRLHAAEDGQEAIEAHAAFKPDIIILDMNMPVKSGLEVMQHIRVTAQDHETQIIVLTAQDTKALKARAFAAGANDFLGKPFDREELLARVGAAAMQVNLTRRLRKAYDRISQEIDLVAGLQKRLLPDCAPLAGECSVECFYRPSGRASGDYYDYFTLPDGSLRVVMADVSGHGARAAFLMAVVRTLVRVSQTHYLSLAETFSLASHHLLSSIGQEPDFVTMAAADINPAEGTITYVNAGHCPPLLVSAGECRWLDPTGTVLGFFEQEFATRTLTFTKPAGLFLFTDGWYEWRTLEKEIFGLERFKELTEKLLAEERFNLGALLENLCGETAGPVFSDDVTGLWVQVGASDYRVFTAMSTPSASRGLAKDVVGAVAEHVEGDDVLHDLDIVLTEACANVTRHAYAGEKGPMEVRLRLFPGDRVEIEVADWGKGLDKAVTFENAAPEAECGRGMYIICKLTDRCEFTRKGRENILKIVKTIRKDLWKT
ncbi:Transcriptional regulatory protein WalR [Fundidesulfovibrio magnetotacticus]|uniref:Transcriptional regulatory protein WalR n=1 Tax=Fundidesulfovibrio magnetotacticus TaxID=2730080 RepID=A0A6V8LQ01_9BACT|nr:SpoIIE family protein phosphatase [Fundidesulfovibrio magnetotacticus]GFK93050.1 Transcriptional regulatory protein WalR [Fundidesulfovibrio magnetotacticus]